MPVLNDSDQASCAGMGFRLIRDPVGEVGADGGRAGRPLVGAGPGASTATSGLDLGGATPPTVGGEILPALLLRCRWLTGITGRCIPPGP